MIKKNIPRKRLLTSLIITNIVLYIALLLFMSLHNKFEKKTIMDVISGIDISTKNDNDIVKEVNLFNLNRNTELYYVNSNGEIITPTDSIYFNFTNIISKHKAVDKNVLLTHDNFRVIKLTDDRFFIFKFSLPPPPNKLIHNITKRDMQKPEYIFFFLSFFLFNFVAIFSYLISNKVLSKKIRQQTNNTDRAMKQIEKREEIEYLQPTGFEDLDTLSIRMNSMIKKAYKNMEVLEKKDEELKGLIQETSHDFKTPLTSINAISQNLLDFYAKLDSETISKNLKSILAEVDFMTKMVEELLYISSLSMSKTENQIFNLSEMIENEIEIHNSNSHIKKEIKSNITLTSNQNQFQRMFKNLLSNAIINCESDVRVRLESNSSNISLTVENDGSEITNKESYGIRSKTRVIDTSNGIHISMGLGSVIIKKVVTNYNGTIDILDRPNGGTIINIKIPIN
jgi:signal transduction histidine kinase